jgi:hypothetical protein
LAVKNARREIQFLLGDRTGKVLDLLRYRGASLRWLFVVAEGQNTSAAAGNMEHGNIPS